LVALWIGKKKPDFNTFLTPFVDQCNLLFEEGITWCHRDTQITSKLHVKTVAADSVASCMLQGIKQFNGFYSCPFCYIKGEKFDMESGGHKMIFLPSDNPERTNDSFLSDLEKLQNNLSSKKFKKTKEPLHVNGVQAASPLVGLQDYNMVKGFVVDYMHTGILGVLRTYTLMLLDSKNSEQEYYLGNDQKKKIVDMFMRCKVPYEVNRSTRDLDEIAYWKANEWKTWLIVCIPILRGILLDQYLDHLNKFVVALSLLLGDKISPDQINEAEQLLKEFCYEAPDLFGKQVCTFNMHLLFHFAQCVRDWGPLWAYSLFQYENANGEMTKLLNGTRQVGMQIVKKVCVMEKLRSTCASTMKNTEAAQFLTSMTENKTYYKHSVKCENKVTMVGPRKMLTLDDRESKLLSKAGIELHEIDCIWLYKHFFVKGHKFCNTIGQNI